MRQPLVDRDQHIHLQHRTIRLLGELVRAVAGADRDRQRVNAGALRKLNRLVGIGDVLEARSARAVSVFNAAQHADLAFDRYAALVRILHHARVTSTFSSKVDGVLPSSFSDPSIITEV